MLSSDRNSPQSVARVNPELAALLGIKLSVLWIARNAFAVTDETLGELGFLPIVAIADEFPVSQTVGVDLDHGNKVTLLLFREIDPAPQPLFEADFGDDGDATGSEWNDNALRVHGIAVLVSPASIFRDTFDKVLETGYLTVVRQLSDAAADSA